MTAKLEIVLIDSSRGQGQAGSQPEPKGAPVAPSVSQSPQARRPANQPSQESRATRSGGGTSKSLGGIVDAVGKSVGKELPQVESLRSIADVIKNLRSAIADSGLTNQTPQRSVADSVGRVKVAPRASTPPPVVPTAIRTPPQVPPIVTTAGRSAAGTAARGAAVAGASGTAASGAATGGGAAALGAAVANPVGLTVAGVVVALGGVAIAAKKLDSKFQGLADTLEDYSPQLSQVAAGREARMFELQLARAGRLGGDLAGIQSAKGRLDEAAYRVQTEIYELLLRKFAPLLEAILDTATAGVEGAAVGKELLDLFDPGNLPNIGKELGDVLQQFKRFQSSVGDVFQQTPSGPDFDIPSFLGVNQPNPAGMRNTPPVSNPFDPGA